MTKSATRVAADKATFTQAEVTAGDTAARAGRKNWIINGDFQISQRGAYSSATSITASPVYYLDRFRCKHNNISGTVVRKTNQTVNGKVTDTMRLTATAGSNGRVEALQMIEDEVFNGQTVTISAWVISNSASARLIIHQNGANIQTSSNAHTGGGAYELLKVTVTCASNAGQLHIYTGIQAAGTGNVAIANGDYFEMAFLQLELGSVATDFEHRSHGEELLLCQRYFQKHHIVWETSLGLTGTVIAPIFPLSPNMRANPTVDAADQNAGGGTTLSGFNALGTASSGYHALYAALVISTSGYSWRYLKGNVDAEL
jgi:hypothetical protein